MKITITLMFLFCAGILQAQTKKFLILDSISHLPIEYASVFIVASNSGSISNAEGVVQINFETNTSSLVKLSHVGYLTKSYSINQLNKIDTVFLIPEAYELQPVSVSNFDLRARLTYVLNNYQNLYVDYPTLKEGTYKETFKGFNKITRLIISDISWWCKSAAYVFNSNINDFFKMELKNITISKNRPLFPTLKGKGYIETKDLIICLYLNPLVNDILKNSKKIYTTSYKESDKTIEIGFETDTTKMLVAPNATIQYEGICVFDKKSKALLSITYNSNLNNFSFNKISAEDKVNYKSTTKRIAYIYSFGNIVDSEKLSPTYIKIFYTGELELNNEIAEIQSINELYLTKEIKEKRFKGKSINVAKPIYQNVATNEPNANSIQLTKEELDFINEK